MPSCLLHRLVLLKDNLTRQRHSFVIWDRAVRSPGSEVKSRNSPLRVLQMLQRQPACLRRSSLVLLVSIIILPSSSTVTRSKTVFVRAPACIKSHLQGITRVRSPRLVLVFIRARQRTNLNGWGETSDRRPALPFPRYHVRLYPIAHLTVSRLKPPLENFDEFRKQLCRIHFVPYRQHSLVLPGSAPEATHV